MVSRSFLCTHCSQRACTVVIIYGLGFLTVEHKLVGVELIRAFLEVNLLRSGFSHNAAAISGKLGC